MPLTIVVPENEELRWQGEWSAGVMYVEGDLVHRLGSTYRALRATQSDDPALEPTAWDLVAQKGDPGQDGEPGPPGLSTSIERAFGLSNVWVWDHGLHTYPTVTTIEDDGARINGDVTYPDTDTVRVDFGNVSFAGKMILG